jgi:N6-L-threonylcarbamoyladenine synthase/N6-L-threonylcarbamoyladenine synthase/protein kinase Bud32
MLDKFGRELDLGFPAGAKIEEMAENGKKLIELPYSVKGMDVAFSGILTAASNLFKNGAVKEDLCHSIQETTFAMLTEVTERAMAHTGIEEVLLGGGVASNKRLRDMLTIMAKERGATFACPPRSLCIDNGAMIAWMGLIMYEGGVRMDIEDTYVKQRFRTDDVDVSWR